MQIKDGLMTSLSEHSVDTSHNKENIPGNNGLNQPRSQGSLPWERGWVNRDFT